MVSKREPLKHFNHQEALKLSIQMKAELFSGGKNLRETLTPVNDELIKSLRLTPQTHVSRSTYTVCL